MMKGNYGNGETDVLLNRRVGESIRGVGVLLLAAATGVVLMSQPSFAATANNTANTLKITPIRTDIQIQAGTTQSVKVTITNLTNSPISVRPIENDFVAGDERGTPALILDADKYAPTHSLKRFMAPLADVVLPAKESRVVSVVMAVPKNAQAGGYFGAVRFAPTSPDGGGQVNLSGSVASLILMTVPGPATEKLNLTNFDIQQNGKTGSTFQTSDNLSLFTRFENTGSIQLGPIGKISVKKGDNVVYSTDFNTVDPREMTLPDSARRWDIPLKNIDGFGHYTALATYTYGTKNQTIEVTKSFWIIPMSVIIGAIIGLIVLILLVVGIILLVRSRKRHNQRNRFGNGYR